MMMGFRVQREGVEREQKSPLGFVNGPFLCLTVGYLPVLWPQVSVEVDMSGLGSRCSRCAATLESRALAEKEPFPFVDSCFRGSLGLRAVDVTGHCLIVCVSNLFYRLLDQRSKGDRCPRDCPRQAQAGRVDMPSPRWTTQ